MSHIRAAFFDADGTLISFNTHEVPASALRALAELRTAGVKCFLCTGRGPYMLSDVPLDVFDACVTFSGQYCFEGDDVFYTCPLDRDDIRVVVEQVQAGLYECYFMEGADSYVSGHDELVRGAESDAKLSMPEGDITRALDHDILQLNVFTRPGGEQMIDDATRHLKFARWSPNFADVMPDNGGKAIAVGRVLERFGIAPEEAVVFGDGGNDVEMFDVVGTSVAMGNSSPEVQAAATHVTDSVDDDGIWNDCVRLGLIG